jgi:hypothetical protein
VDLRAGLDGKQHFKKKKKKKKPWEGGSVKMNVGGGNGTGLGLCPLTGQCFFSGSAIREIGYQLHIFSDV